MTDHLTFTMDFHRPFRVGASHGRDGTHQTIDPDEPIGAAHLKGLMRAAARTRLLLPDTVVDRVFGSTTSPCPWSWEPARPESDWGTTKLRTRISIDPEHHATIEDHLVVAEQLATCTRATFTVTRYRHIAAGLDSHLLVLRCAGAAVHNLGAWRHRGLGWVGITPDPAVTAADITALRALREEI
ncbi:hypothetical protein ACWDXV_34240 [Nocardia nova]